MNFDIKWLLKRSQLKQNILSGVLAAGLQGASNLVAYPIYIHYLGYEQYGTWLILAILINLTQLGIAGIGPAISQLVAEADARDDHHKLKSYVTWSAILVGAATLLLTVFSWLMGPVLASLLSLPESAQGSTSLIPLVACLSGYFLWVEIFSSVLSGLGRIDQTNLVTSLGQAVIVFVAFLLLRQGWGILSLIAGYFTGRAAVNIVVFGLIRRRYHHGLFTGRTLAITELTRLCKVSGSILSGTMLNVLLNPFNKWVIAVSMGVSRVPIYEIAFGASFQLRNLFEFGLRALIPETSRANAIGSAEARARILSVFRKTLVISMLVGIPLYLAVGMSAHQIFGLWLHKMLQPSQVEAFRILLFGSFFSMMGASAYYCLIGLRALAAVFHGYVIQVILNVILVAATLLLAHQVSVTTVCAATSVSVGAAGLYLIASCFSRLRAVPSETKNRPIAAGIAG
jgi:O-antigen/teichoic acid export membrane protein